MSTAAAEARRLGSFRRRKESAVALTFDFEGLETEPKIRRLLEVGELEAPVATLEAAVGPPA